VLTTSSAAVLCRQSLSGQIMQLLDLTSNEVDEAFIDKFEKEVLDIGSMLLVRFYNDSKPNNFIQLVIWPR
jgi:hypothetical protein